MELSILFELISVILAIFVVILYNGKKDGTIVNIQNTVIWHQFKNCC